MIALAVYVAGGIATIAACMWVSRWIVKSIEKGIRKVTRT
jgi:hypothetical protein